MIKVAVGIMRLGSQVLVCQRKRTSRYPLKWEFPGGKFEEGETAEQCLFRELQEELSIEANIGEEFLHQQWEYPDSGSFEIFYHHIPSYSGFIRNNVFEQIRWTTLDDLPSFDILEGNKEAVTLLVKATLNGKK